MGGKPLGFLSCLCHSITYSALTDKTHVVSLTNVINSSCNLTQPSVHQQTMLPFCPPDLLTVFTSKPKFAPGQGMSIRSPIHHSCLFKNPWEKLLFCLRAKIDLLFGDRDYNLNFNISIFFSALGALGKTNRCYFFPCLGR